ncbi:sensor histidine kinase [Paenibacillus yanchengensis]|uniref:histidine kinase n=1 Tax=Paenibacillus yanchengensis TaxID=2035833 RepID=A0ABW4YNN2_9BACL
MKSINIKIASFLTILLCVLEIVLLVYLLQTVLHSRFQEEVSRILRSGSNHRSVLEDHYSEETIKHIALMENNPDTGVVIMNVHRDIIGQSNNGVISELEKLDMDKLFQSPDQLVVKHWRTTPYLVSVHPYEAKQESGILILFQSTEALHSLDKELQKQFLIAGVFIFLIVVTLYILLTRVITRPLWNMRKATEQLSTGDYTVTIPVYSRDEIGQLAVTIQNLAYELQSLQQSRNDFLASVAHELGTPLTYLIGYVKVAQRPTTSPEQLQRYLTIIQEEAQRMTKLVQDLMELARLGEVHFSIKREVVSIPALLQQMEQMMSRQFEEKQVRLQVKTSEEIVVLGDPIRLQQVFTNLLDNALQHSHAGQTVTIAAEQSKEAVIFTVIDEGDGIAPEHVPFVFDRMYRVDQSRARHLGGAGLGLSIAKEIIQAHQGTIVVTSKVGRGTTFTVTLKRVKQV